MQTIALVTCDKWPNLIESDQLMIPLLEKHGITTVPAVWDNLTVEWQKFDAVIIRSTWDYYERYPAFCNWLDKIERLKIPMYNDIDTIRYNIDKRYLRDIETHGHKVVKSLWVDKGSGLLSSALENAPWSEMVIKPTISAGSYLTKRFTREDIPSVLKEYTPLSDQHSWVIQPYLSEIVEKGEVSLLYFNGEYSHAVIKKPAKGDFRIQSQFGGIYEPFEPSKDHVAEGALILRHIDPHSLYGRVDMIELDGVYHVMEVEMIEPDLYLNVHPEAIHRFIEALVEKVGG